MFLDNDAAVIDGLRRALSLGMGREIELVQRRTYQEITGLLLERSVDAAWLCGYPYLQHADLLDLVAVPVWRGGPRYQSYLIVGAEDGAASLTDLRGGTHAFSDPDSNSGYLVTATDLRRMGEQVESFFSRSIFTFGHRNVVRAVADGLVQSGSVDGYVWEALAVIEPDLTARTRVIARSEWLGFPPVCARRDSLATEPVRALQTALMNLSETDEGRRRADIAATRWVSARDSGSVRRDRGPHARSGPLRHEVVCPHTPLDQAAAACGGDDGACGHGGLPAGLAVAGAGSGCTYPGTGADACRGPCRSPSGPLVLRHDIWEVYDTLDRAAQAGEGRRMVLTAVADERGRRPGGNRPKARSDGQRHRSTWGEAVALDSCRWTGPRPFSACLRP